MSIYAWRRLVGEAKQKKWTFNGNNESRKEGASLAAGNEGKTKTAEMRKRRASQPATNENVGERHEVEESGRAKRAAARELASYLARTERKKE